MLEALKALIRPRRIIPLLILVTALGFAVERIWVTDAERVKGILDDARTYCLEGNWTGVIDLLDPDYAFENLSREDIREIVRKKVQSKPLQHFQYLSREVEVLEGGWAVARITVIVRLPPGTGSPDDRLGGSFEIRFRKREDLGWVIASMRLVQ